MSEVMELTVNGRRRVVGDCALETTLLEWLRDAGLTGTKMGCSEGDCGACTVSLVDYDGDGARRVRSINSCIALVRTLVGREILTVEGLAKDGELHPVQKAMVDCNGSQCGFCTPGFVMSMYEGYERGVLGDEVAVADQLCGNLCRCTGYRAIAEAARVAGERRGAAATSGPGAGERSVPEDLSLERLLKLRAERPGAVLVAGATEVGVEVTKRFRRLPAVISITDVPELRRCERTEAGWRIGAGATLTEVEDFLAGELPIFGEMLRWFASRQIRNRATLGGNLVTASPIGDSAPVLLVLGARVELLSVRGKRVVALEDFFVGYRQTVLAPDEVMVAVLIDEGGRGEDERFYKVSKRREMDISIVSAAFVRRAGQVRCAFGGVAATPVVLTVDWRPGDDPDGVAEELDRRFQPLTDARGSAAYRRGVVADLWRKYCESAGVIPPHSPVEVADGVDPSTDPPHESAVGHVTGAAQYVDDIAMKRGTLTMWPVGAEHAHARVLSLDVDAAREMPGVVAVLTAADVPGVNDVGCSRPDETLFADKLVEFHGHLLAVIIGEDEAACRAAAKTVAVEYETLPALVTIAQAREADSFHTDENSIRRGDVGVAIAGAKLTLSGEFSLGGQEHFYLETQAAWAEVAPDGGIHVCSSTQHPTEIQIIVARVLGLSRNAVVVEAPRMGGGFGGKETQGNTWAALAALGAVVTGRPVRVMLDRDLDVKLTGKRHPFWSSFEVGYGEDGVLAGLRVELISNGGWSLDLSMPIADRALFHLDNAYYVPASDYSARVAKTNLVSNTAFRGFGGPQGMLVVEEILDRVARDLGLVPEVVRERTL
ncbi:MAG: molybdopterin cofactor-binding domain-containing protein, partial [Chthoniobacterales bacterium]